MPPDPSARFITKMFAKHYREAPLTMPERFSRREFGFMFFDRDFMMRHLSFPSRASLKSYLVEHVPAHAYHSCAYYEKPDAPNMVEKKWLGADLIFDLDADHVEGTKGLPYEQMLVRVREEVIRLIDEFLLDDLGFAEEDLRIVFSGGRGYHVHISSPRVIRLSSHERREIVDYITGTDLDLDWVFPTTPFEASRFKDRPALAYKRGMPRVEDGGWKRRMRVGVDAFLEDLEKKDKEVAISTLTNMVSQSSKEIGTKTVEGLYKDLFGGSQGKRGVDRMRAEDTFEVFSQKRHADAFLELVGMKVKMKMRGETDEPVTSDIKRLIRLPTSLHGKTGFEVVPISREELTNFDPFENAVPEAFGDSPIRVKCGKALEVKMRGKTHSLDAGPNEVPEHVAVHLACRKLASIES